MLHRHLPRSFITGAFALLLSLSIGCPGGASLDGDDGDSPPDMRPRTGDGDGDGDGLPIGDGDGDATGDGDGDTTGDGDGDTTGDGDGDPTGDGDGDPTGDGDGDPTGDGDGDPTGDGDGDPTGDGDGDPTGDGDGDGDGDGEDGGACPDDTQVQVDWVEGSQEDPSICFVNDWGCATGQEAFFDQACGCACVGTPDEEPPPDDGLCEDTCQWAGDGECDDGGEGSDYSVCDLGSDCEDCGVRDGADTDPEPEPEPDPEPQGICENTCQYAGDGECDDGGEGADYNVCAWGSDCDDCGVREGGGDGDGDPDPTGGGQIHVVGFGDSVTVGYCSSQGRSYFDLLVDNDDGAYPDFAGNDLSSHFSSVTTNNQAINATTSCDFQDWMLADELASDPNTDGETLLLITLGGNDLIHDYGCGNPHECAAYCADYADVALWAQNYEERMIGFIEAAQASVDGELHIFLATIYDPTDGHGDIENAVIFGGAVQLPPWPDGLDALALYNDTIAQIALATGATLVDMHGAMLGHGLHYDDPSSPHYAGPGSEYWYCDNLEDPNDAGYDAVRRVFWDAISDELGL